jgi:hypothetical protein
MSTPQPTGGRSKTRAQRAAEVEAAATALRDALAAALASPDDESLWSVVETHGAVIHRQSRLLAGKSKGG